MVIWYNHFDPKWLFDITISTQRCSISWRGFLVSGTCTWGRSHWHPHLAMHGQQAFDTSVYLLGVVYYGIHASILSYGIHMVEKPWGNKVYMYVKVGSSFLAPQPLHLVRRIKENTSNQETVKPSENHRNVSVFKWTSGTASIQHCSKPATLVQWWKIWKEEFELYVVASGATDPTAVSPSPTSSKPWQMKPKKAPKIMTKPLIACQIHGKTNTFIFETQSWINNKQLCITSQNTVTTERRKTTTWETT